MRLRIYEKNEWLTKDVILARKQTEFNEAGKTSNIVFKKEFDKEEEAKKYFRENFKEFKEKFRYSWKGWQYEAGKNQLFIEDIEGFDPSIEILSENKKDLTNLLSEVGAGKIFEDPVP